MNILTNILSIKKSLMIISLGFLISPCLHAAIDPPKEKSGVIEAEYQGKKIEFPLLKSHYRVDIQGDLATIELEQTFSNPSKVALNATYLFPLNQDAAVYAMKMHVGDEIINAEIKRIEEAKQVFDAAKKEGKAASLLVQHRPNMFTQNLANLMPNLPIKVTLKYTQAIKRKDHQYELVLPLLVGPRYQPPSAIPAIKQTVNSQTQFGKWELQTLPETPPTMGIDIPKTLEKDRVSISVRLNAALPIKGVSSQTHLLSKNKQEDGSVLVNLKNGSVVDNRDFVLRYQLAGKQVQAGLLTHKDENGNFFSLLIEPPQISTEANTLAREMVFVLDTSGSMSGYPLDASKAFMKHALNTLRPNDYFRIIDFGESPREFSSAPLQANNANLSNGLSHVDQLEAKGGTNITSAIEQAFITSPIDNHLRIVVFLTDGYIGDEATVLSKINAIRGNARIYSLGVGSNVNRYLLDEMGIAGHGFTRYIDPIKNVEDSAIQFANYLSTPVLSDISIDWGTLKPHHLTPKNLPDLFIGDSLRILGKFAQAKNTGEHIIKVSGFINGKKATISMKVNTEDTEKADNKHSQSIPLIWARTQIKELMRDFNLPSRQQIVNDTNPEQTKQNIIKLGLDHSLMTRWTSFIAVSEKVVNEQKIAKDAQVPLPMPAGVSKYAYAEPSQNYFAGSSAPEPSVIRSLLLMGLIVGLLGWYRRRARSLSEN